MRRFFLKRLKDVSGSSGVGCVAEGVEFEDGTAVLHWFPGVADAISTGIYPNGLAALERVHGHGGNTFIDFIDEGHAAHTGASGADATFAFPSASPSPKIGLPAPA